jgi:hypothetical protein
MDARKCCICHAEKPKSEFHKNAKRCKLCNTIYMRDYYLRNRERIIANVSAYTANNRVQVTTYLKKYYHENSEKAKVRAHEWADENRNRRREIVRKYDASNKAQKIHRKVVRLGREARAMPVWANIQAMNAFYAACPPGHHVDHIVPLVAKRGNKHVASGLHWEGNLQYLPARENVRKGCKLDDATTVPET